MKIIRKKQAKKVDLGNKFIFKYTSPSKDLEINHMIINGRHPENPDHFIWETECHFMIFVVKGEGTVYTDDKIFKVKKGDCVDFPPKTKFAIKGRNFEYLTVDTPAWFPSQAKIVDRKGNVVEDTEK